LKDGFFRGGGTFGGVIPYSVVASHVTSAVAAGGVAVVDLAVDEVLFAAGAAGIREFLFVFFGLLDGGADFGFDFGASAGIAAAGRFDDFVEVVLWGGREGEGGGGESGDFFAVDDHGDNEVAVVHLD